MRNRSRTGVLVGSFGVLAVLVAFALSAWGPEQPRGKAPVARPGSVGGSVQAVEALEEQSVDGRPAAGMPGVPDSEARTSVVPTPLSTRLRVIARRADTGAPVAGHAVLLVGETVFARRAACTDPAGEVVFDRLEPGRYQLDGSGQAVELEAGEHADVELELAPRFELDGLVIDEQGRPIPGAEVWTSSAHLSFDGAVHTATTGADGRFGWTSFRAIEYVFARAAGHVPSPVFDCTREFVHDGDRSMRIVLRRAAVVEVAGQVLSAADGRAIAGAAVALRPRAPEPVEGLEDAGSFLRAARRAPQQVTETDAEGRFRFRDVSPGDASLRVRAAGHGLLDRTVELVAPRTTRLECRLGAPLSLRGQVVDPDGAPVGGAVLAPTYASDLFSTVARSDAEGWFELGPLPGRRLRITVRAAGFAQSIDDVRIPDDQRQGTHRFQLQRESALRGVLFDESGRPLGGWHVATVGGRVESVETDAEGRFVLRGDAPPTLVGHAPAARVGDPLGPARRLVRAEQPDDTGRWVWRALEADAPSVTLAGRLRIDPPLDDPRVVLWLSAPGLRLLRRVPLQLRGDGEALAFESGPWSPGEYELALLPGDGEERLAEHALGRWTLSADSRVDLGVIELPGAVPLEVAIRWPTGVSTRGVQCLLHEVTSGEQIAAGLDLDGRFHSVPLAPGGYRLRLAGSGFAPVERRFTLVAGRPERLEIEPESARDLLLRCDWQRDGPLRGRAVVDVIDHDSGEPRGTLVVWAVELLRHGARVGLPDGRYLLRLRAGGDPVPVFFTPGGDREVRFVVP